MRAEGEQRVDSTFSVDEIEQLSARAGLSSANRRNIKEFISQLNATGLLIYKGNGRYKPAKS